MGRPDRSGQAARPACQADGVRVGSVDLTFIGRFAELPGDVVFTVRKSVRTAMMAVLGLTGSDKPMIPMHEPIYDIRVIASSFKSTLAIDKITPQNLTEIARYSPPLPDLLAFINGLPEPVT